MEEVNNYGNEFDDTNMINAEGLGEPVFIDQLNQLKFFTAYRTCRLKVSLGDCVRINLEVDDDEVIDNNNNNYDSTNDGYAQVLSIFEDKNSEMFIEVRWFLQKSEIISSNNYNNMKKLELKDNELVETDSLDDIPAGSVAEIIEIKEFNSKQSKNNNNNNNGSFICRYLETSGLNINNNK